MADLTTNYSLEKATENEYYDVSLHARNMDKIDTALKNNANAIATRETPVGAQAKADAAQAAAEAYTDQEVADLAGAGRTTETVKGNADALAAHLADNTHHIPHLGTTSNSGNAYSITTIQTISTNGKFSVTFNVAATGTATLNISSIGSAKPLKKPGGEDFKPKAGPYTLFYDGSNFILQGEGGEYGNAQAQHVLAPYTIGTEDGLIEGTMPTAQKDGSSIFITTGLPSFANVYDGIIDFYNDFEGYVPIGYLRRFFSNLTPANIKSGVVISDGTGAGITGTLEPRKYAYLTPTVNASLKISVTGLTFRPKMFVYQMQTYTPPNRMGFYCESISSTSWIRVDSGSNVSVMTFDGSNSIITDSSLTLYIGGDQGKVVDLYIFG